MPGNSGFRGRPGWRWSSGARTGNRRLRWWDAFAWSWNWQVWGSLVLTRRRRWRRRGRGRRRRWRRDGRQGKRRRRGRSLSAVGRWVVYENDKLLSWLTVAGNATYEPSGSRTSQWNDIVSSFERGLVCRCGALCERRYINIQYVVHPFLILEYCKKKITSFRKKRKRKPQNLSQWNLHFEKGGIYIMFGIEDYWEWVG